MDLGARLNRCCRFVYFATGVSVEALFCCTVTEYSVYLGQMATLALVISRVPCGVQLLLSQSLRPVSGTGLQAVRHVPVFRHSAHRLWVVSGTETLGLGILRHA